MVKICRIAIRDHECCIGLLLYRGDKLRRALTIEMIRKLHEGLGISAETLIRPYSVRRSAA